MNECSFISGVFFKIVYNVSGISIIRVVFYPIELGLQRIKKTKVVGLSS